MSRPVPSGDELLALMTAKVAEARASLRSAVEIVPPRGPQREEYERLLTALDELERRIARLQQS